MGAVLTLGDVAPPQGKLQATLLWHFEVRSDACIQRAVGLLQVVLPPRDRLAGRRREVGVGLVTVVQIERQIGLLEAPERVIQRGVIAAARSIGHHEQIFDVLPDRIRRQYVPGRVEDAACGRLDLVELWIEPGVVQLQLQVGDRQPGELELGTLHRRLAGVERLDDRGIDGIGHEGELHIVELAVEGGSVEPQAVVEPVGLQAELPGRHLLGLEGLVEAPGSRTFGGAASLVAGGDLGVSAEGVAPAVAGSERRVEAREGLAVAQARLHDQGGAIERIGVVLYHEVALGLAPVLGEACAEREIEAVVQHRWRPGELSVAGIRGRLCGDEALAPGERRDATDPAHITAAVLEVVRAFMEVVQAGDVVDGITHIADELELLRGFVVVDLVDRVRGHGECLGLLGRGIEPEVSVAGQRLDGQILAGLPG